MGLEPAVMRPTAIGIIIPRVTRIGDSMAISSLGIPYSTSFREVAASVTANAAVERMIERERERERERFHVKCGAKGARVNAKWTRISNLTRQATQQEKAIPAWE